MDHRPLSERGLAKEPQSRATAFFASGVRAVGIRLEVERQEVVAVHRLAAEAVSTSTVKGWRQHHMVARRDLGHVPPYLLYDTGAFVTEHIGKGGVDQTVLAGQIGMAKTHADDTYQHFVIARPREIDVF